MYNTCLKEKNFKIIIYTIVVIEVVTQTTHYNKILFSLVLWVITHNNNINYTDVIKERIKENIILYFLYCIMHIYVYIFKNNVLHS